MEREKTSSKGLADAFDEAGFEGVTTVHTLTPADKRRSKQVSKFLEETKKAQERSSKRRVFFD